MIRYLRHNQIDIEKWDKCIENAVNSLIYARSWYLDIVSPNWEALVEGDYETVMPLPVKKKFGLHYLIQPKWCQQLGIFSDQKLVAEQINRFVKSIPNKFIWRNFNYNFLNEPLNNFPLRLNYELNLTNPIQIIQKQYNTNTKRNIKKAIQNEIEISESTDFSEFMVLYAQFAKIKPDKTGCIQLEEIIKYAIKINCGKILIAKTRSGSIISGAFFLQSFRRTIYLTSFNTLDGEKNAAMFLIMDSMICNEIPYSNIFDFEGSMIPSIARFFAGFGAEAKPYPMYKNRLARIV